MSARTAARPMKIGSGVDNMVRFWPFKSVGHLEMQGWRELPLGHTGPCKHALALFPCRRGDDDHAIDALHHASRTTATNIQNHQRF